MAQKLDAGDPYDPADDVEPVDQPGTLYVQVLEREAVYAEFMDRPNTDDPLSIKIPDGKLFPWGYEGMRAWLYFVGDKCVRAVWKPEGWEDEFDRKFLQYPGVYPRQNSRDATVQAAVNDFIAHKTTILTRCDAVERGPKPPERQKRNPPEPRRPTSKQIGSTTVYKSEGATSAGASKSSELSLEHLRF